MKTKNLLKKLLFMIALCTPLSLSAVDTRGTDFWVTFGDNLNRPITQINLQVRVVGAGQAATGTIHFTELGTSRTFSVAANGVFTYDFTDEEKTATYNRVMGINNRSVRITSSAPVMVYALNQSSASTDATNVLPITALGTEYFQISYQPIHAPGGYAVIATENTTRVYHDGVLAATLNAGQVYYRVSSTVDMTGSRITADKPIAFFMLLGGVNIPVGTTASDNQFQQLAPVHTWGRNFFVPVSHRNTERVRIVASQDGTNITQVGATLPTVVGSQNRLTDLNAGEWVELQVRLADGGVFIQSNHPVGVCSYMVGQSFPGIAGQGDPSTTWVPPIEQMIPSATIAPFIPAGGTNLNAHFAIIVVHTDAKNQTIMSVGGGAPAPISGGTWHDHPTAGYSFYILQLQNDATLSYTFSNSEGLLVFAYGTGSAETYYYVAGSAFRTLNAAFFANNIHNQDLSSHVFGTNQINFRTEIQGDVSTQPGHIRWFIDGVEDVSLRDQATWSRNLPNGTYLIVLEVLMDDNITVRRVEGTLTIATATIIANPHIRKLPQ